MKLFRIVIILLLFFSKCALAGVLFTPDPALWHSDVGVESFIHSSQTASVEIFDRDSIEGFTTFGFYFSGHADDRFIIFEETDQCSPSPCALGASQSALIDFTVGKIFDVDESSPGNNVIQSIFTPRGISEIGFFLGLQDPDDPLTTHYIYSERAENPGSFDFSGTFTSKAVPTDHLIVFESAKDVLLSVNLVTGFTAVAVPGPSSLYLFVLAIPLLLLSSVSRFRRFSWGNN